MSSASKTLELLEHFSPERPEIGLSQMCKLASRDKATTYRYLQSLETVGFVEQSPTTKHYRLGPALLQLAQTRETTVPRKAAAEKQLHDLAAATGESTHISVLSGNTLYKLMAVESPRHSIRVIVDIQTFPLHATASGLCALAFGPERLSDFAKLNLTAFTPNTIVDVDALKASIADTFECGFGRAAGSMETDVFSLAAPVFDQTGLFAGAISVASVAARFIPDLERLIKEQLIVASREVTRNWGGIVPANVEQAWTKTMAQTHELENV